MIRSIGQDRLGLGQVLLLVSILSATDAQAQDGQLQELERRGEADQGFVLRREAPVFTYRHFTAQLPAFSSSPEEMDPPEASTFSLPAQPKFPASVHPVRQEQAGLMGRFGETIDAGAAQEGLSGARSEPSPAEPSTTTAVAAQPETADAHPGHEPRAAEARLLGSGRASWYKHPGRTANGEQYDPNKLTAAHHTLPFGTKVKVVNTRNGRSVIVRITDRTNERTKAKRNYAIDLSRASAQRIGIAGIGRVALYQVE